MTRDLRFEVVPPAEAFGPLRASWEEQLVACGADTIFLTPEWIECWWEAYGAGRIPLIMAARRGASLVGILPLAVSNERWKRTLPLRTLRFLGDGTYDSDYLDFLLAPGEEEEILDSAWCWLRSSSGPRFDWAQFREMSVTSPRHDALRALLRRRGELVEEERIGCVVAPLPATFDAYLRSLRPRMRTKLRSLRRDLESRHAVRLLECESLDQARHRLPSLFELHARRWARRGLPGVFAGARKRTFYDHLTRTLLERGWLQFHTLEVDGTAVAHQYCIGYKGTVYLLQEGYDPAWEARGVGNVLRAMVLERLIREGWAAYDFLGGVTEHKRSWGGTVKESARFAARGPGVRGALVAALLRTVSAARGRLAGKRS